jgi:hypothetical protein
MVTKVVNLKTDSYDVYIGRGSKWGGEVGIILEGFFEIN